LPNLVPEAILAVVVPFLFKLVGAVANGSKQMAPDVEGLGGNGFPGILIPLALQSPAPN